MGKQFYLLVFGAGSEFRNALISTPAFTGQSYDGCFFLFLWHSIIYGMRMLLSTTKHLATWHVLPVARKWLMVPLVAPPFLGAGIPSLQAWELTTSVGAAPQRWFIFSSYLDSQTFGSSGLKPSSQTYKDPAFKFNLTDSKKKVGDL